MKPPARCRARLPWGACSLAVVCWLIFAGVLPAQQVQPKRVVPFEGTQAFQHLLHMNRLRPLKGLDELRRSHPADTVVIVLGDPEPLARIEESVGGLHHFLDRGGAVLIASDRNCNFLWDSLGLRISGRPVAGYWRGEHYKGVITACPLLREFADDKHPLVADLNQGIATNNPSRLVLDPLGLLRHVLVSGPNFQRRWPPWAGGHALPEISAMLAVSTPKTRGRAVALSGHGVFMNGMMAQKDNDNFKFAYNTVRWLSGEGKRGRVLLFEEGQLRQTLDVPLTVPAHWPLPTVAMVNKALDSAQKDDLFNKLALFAAGSPYEGDKDDRMRSGQHRILWGLFSVLSLLLLGLLGLRLWRARRRPEPRLRTVSHLLAGAGSAAPPLARRRAGLLGHGNLWEPARALARQWFATHYPEHAPGPTAPPVEAASRGGRHWRGEVRRLWGLAYGQPARVSPHNFRDLLRRLQRLTDALRAGEFQFQDRAPVGVAPPSGE